MLAFTKLQALSRDSRNGVTSFMDIPQSTCLILPNNLFVNIQPNLIWNAVTSNDFTIICDLIFMYCRPYFCAINILHNILCYRLFLDYVKYQYRFICKIGRKLLRKFKAATIQSHIWKGLHLYCLANRFLSY